MKIHVPNHQAVSYDLWLVDFTNSCGDAITMKNMEIVYQFKHEKYGSILLVGGAITILKNMSSPMGRIIPIYY